jgi:CxxC motif-containing protein
MAKHEVICIGCPLGCRISIRAGKGARKIELKGAECAEGKKYALSEYQNPVRVFTATVLTGDVSQPLLPVRTNKPIPRKLLKKAMLDLVDIKPKPPIKIGKVLAKNFLKSGADLIATCEWKA